MFQVRAVSQMQTLVAKATDSLDDAVETAKKLQAVSTHGLFKYEVWDGPDKVWPAQEVSL